MIILSAETFDHSVSVSKPEDNNSISNNIHLNNQPAESEFQQNDLATEASGSASGRGEGRRSLFYKFFSSALELCKQELRLLNTQSQRVPLKIADRDFQRNVVDGYNFTGEESLKQRNNLTNPLKSVWLKGCKPQQKYCLIPLITHKPKTTTTSVQTDDHATISDLEILLSKLINNNHDMKIEVLITKKNGKKSKINTRTLLQNIRQHEEIIDDFLSPPSMATQTVDPVIYHDFSCQTETDQTTIGCQTVIPQSTDATTQVVPPECMEASVQVESKLVTTSVQAVAGCMDAFVQAKPELTSTPANAVPEYTEACVQAAPTLIAHSTQYDTVVKSCQVQTTQDVQDVFSQVARSCTTNNLFIQIVSGLKEIFAKTSPTPNGSGVPASSVSNVQFNSLQMTQRSTSSDIWACSLNTNIRGRAKRAMDSAAGEVSSFSSVIYFKNVLRSNLQVENHSATLPGRASDIPNRMQHSCPVPIMSKAFAHKIRKARLGFVLGVEPTVQQTSSAALLDPAYFLKKTSESRHQEEDAIVEDSPLEGSLKENFDIASLVYINSFGNFSMNQDVMMAMFGYDPRHSPFLASGYETLNDLPEDLDSVIVPSIRSKDIVFHKNEDESFKEIGRGSYGVVYLGRLLKTSKQIVVKDFFNKSVSWEFVEHEAQIVALLQGKGVTPNFHGIMTSTIDKNDFSLVQEFFGSGSIETILKHHDDLSVHSWITICTNISKALFNIHSCHVIHNDVKADNILVDLDGFDVRFIDFGMSTFRKGLQFTASPEYMSKFQFMAPEVRENCHSTPQSDIFSLGFLFGQIMAQAKVIQLRPLWRACTSVRALSRPRLPHIIATLEELQSNLQPKFIF